MPFSLTLTEEIFLINVKWTKSSFQLDWRE